MKSFFKKLTGPRSPPDPLSSLGHAQPDTTPPTKPKLTPNQVRAIMVSSVSCALSQNTLHADLITLPK